MSEDALSPFRRARTALRLALRDLRRSPREGFLAAALVALPAAVMTLIATVHASQLPTLEERLTAELGRSQSWVRVVDPLGGPLTQDPSEPFAFASADNSLVNTTTAEPQELTVSDIEAMLPASARTIRLAESSVVAATDDRITTALLVEGHAWDVELVGVYSVVDGNVARANNEVMISPFLAQTLGLRVGDTVTLGDEEGTFSVTGILKPRIERSAVGTVFTAAGVIGTDLGVQAQVWYLTDQALTWNQIQLLNQSGVIAYSRSVAANPPEGGAFTAIQEPIAPTLLAAGAVGMFGASLLAGAGFAVSFRRQRRSMATLGAQGAHQSLLASIGVARGGWLGLAGGLMGLAIGLLTGWAWVWLLLNYGGAEGQSSTWGYHVAWEVMPVVVLYGVAIGMVAAFLPAVTASKLDVLAVLRGSSQPRRVRRWPAVVGAITTAVGVATVIFAAKALSTSLDLQVEIAYAARSKAAFQLALGTVVTFVGLALTIPIIVRLAARLASAMTIGLRLAIRDLDRSPGRTVPVVIAMSVSIALSSAMLLTLNRDYTEQLANFRPYAPQGDALVTLMSDTQAHEEAATVVAAAHKALPHASVTVVDAWTSFYSEAEMDRSAVPGLLVPKENLCPEFYGFEEMTQRDVATDPRCRHDVGTVAMTVAVGDAGTLRTLTGKEPSAEAIAALESGQFVVFNPLLLDQGSVTVGFWNVDAGSYPNDGAPERTTTYQGVYQERVLGDDFRTAAIVSPSTAAQIGSADEPALIFIDDIETITQAHIAQIMSEALRDGVTLHNVQLGAGRNDQYTIVASFAIVAVALVLVIVSITIALGLARADARQDDLTLADGAH